MSCGRHYIPTIPRSFKIYSCPVCIVIDVVSSHCMFLLLVSEISRVRKDMYNDTLNGSTDKRSSELPDAVGPIVQLQEKLYVPVKEYPDVSRTTNTLTFPLEMMNTTNTKTRFKVFVLLKTRRSIIKGNRGVSGRLICFDL